MTKAILSTLLATSVASFAGTASIGKGSPVAGGATGGEAATASTSWEFMAGYDTQYMFRGSNYGKNLSYADLGYSFSLGDKLTAEVGAWFAVVPEGVNGSFTEVDYYATLDYAISEATTFGLGFTLYTYNGIGWPNEPEVTARLDHNFGIVEASLLYAHDFEVKGDYVQLSLTHTHEISESIALEATALVAYNNHYFMEASGGNHVGVSLALPIGLCKNVELVPYVSYQWAIDAARDAGLVEDDIYGGVSLTVGF